VHYNIPLTYLLAYNNNNNSNNDNNNNMNVAGGGGQAKSGALRIEELSTGVSQLVISDVSRSYAGQLSCSAHNDAGSTSDDFAVVVHCKQHFTRPATCMFE